MKIVRRYNEIENRDKVLVGGKGWAIAKLAQIDVPVPNGFCITSELTAGMVGREPELAKCYRAYLNGIDNFGETDRILAGQVDRRIDEVSVQQGLELELESALRNNTPNILRRIIVRSSASSEDSAGASFAGQFRSVVTENKINDLVEALRECWKSMTSPSLGAYAFARRVRLSGMSFAFVVQEFLECEYAGVLFTRNLGRGEPGDFLIEYAKGGAEQVVSGRVTPSSCLLKGGTESIEWVRRSAGIDGPTKTDLVELGHLANKAKELFQADQDIEWGMSEGMIYILQSRPITTS